MRLWASPQKRRWILWGILAGAFLLVNFQRVTSAVLAEDLAAVFDASAAQLGLLYSSFFWIYAAMQVPAGLLADRAGPRAVATAGGVLMAAGVFGFALSDSLLAGFLTRALVGLGGSVIYISTLRFLANWFRPREFATMTGWTISAAGVGGILATTPLALSVDAFGWRETLIATGGLTLAFAVATYAFVRDQPADAGFEPLAGVAPPTTTSLSDVVANTKAVLGERDTWMMGLITFFVIGMNFTVLGLWAVPYIVHVYDVTVTRASTYVLLGNVGFVLGPPSIGWLSDRIGRRTDMILLSSVGFTLAYGTIALTVAPPLPVVGAVLFVAMFLNGGVALVYTVAKERHPSEASGTITGAINSLAYFGVAVFPPLLGKVLDAYWTGQTVNGSRIYTTVGYRIAFVIVTVGGILATLCALWLFRQPHRRVTGETAADATE